MKIEGVLKSIDSQMNMEITDLNIGALPPMLQNLKSMHIRGNAIKYITLDKNEIGQKSLDKLTQDCRDTHE